MINCNGKFIESAFVGTTEIESMYLNNQLVWTKSKPVEVPEDYIYSIENDNTISLVFYIGDDKRVSIPKSILGLPVKRLEATVFNYKPVYEVVIPDGILAIY